MGDVISLAAFEGTSLPKATRDALAGCAEDLRALDSQCPRDPKNPALMLSYAEYEQRVPPMVELMTMPGGRASIDIFGHQYFDSQFHSQHCLARLSGSAELVLGLLDLGKRLGDSLKSVKVPFSPLRRVPQGEIDDVIGTEADANKQLRIGAGLKRWVAALVTMPLPRQMWVLYSKEKTASVWVYRHGDNLVMDSVWVIETVLGPGYAAGRARQPAAADSLAARAQRAVITVKKACLAADRRIFNGNDDSNISRRRSQLQQDRPNLLGCTVGQCIEVFVDALQPSEKQALRAAGYTVP